MSRKIRVNGTEYDGSIILKIAGEEEISYSDKVTRTKTYGMTGRHRAPRGRTKGKYEPDDSTMKGSKKGMKEIRRKLTALGDGVITRPEFQVTVSFIDEDGDSTTDILHRAKVLSHKGGANANSPDPAVEDWSLDIMGIKWDGDSTLYEPDA
jgi:hypothetical protein